MEVTEHRGIIVLAESIEAGFTNITKELLGYGRILADNLAEELSTIILGVGITDLGQEAISYGADRVYIVDNPFLKDYRTEPYTDTLEIIAKQTMPRFILMGQTSIGRDLAPRLAFRLGTSATTDCIELAIDDESKQLLQTKFVYGGNAVATYTSEYYPQIATVRSKIYSVAEPDSSRRGDVITVDVKLESISIRTRVLNKVAQVKEGIKLEDAATVVAGGRGIGSVEGFRLLEELADLLGGAIGATRPPCDNNWIQDSAQIGLTGKIIAPDLYFAIALSGSSQHISGCSGARNIIAINKDAEANIFNFARFGIVGDWKNILLAFTETVKELQAE